MKKEVMQVEFGISGTTQCQAYHGGLNEAWNEGGASGSEHASRTAARNAARHPVDARRYLPPSTCHLLTAQFYAPAGTTWSLVTL